MNPASMEYQNLPQERSAFLAIVGKPNVGKSSVLNRLIGQKIAIVSKNRRPPAYPYYGSVYGRGIPTGIFGYPGLIKPKNPLGDYMVKSVTQSINGVDACLLVTGGWRKSIKGR